MNVDANSSEASGHGVAGERKLILPPRLVEERRRKDAEAEAFFKQCDAYIARWEEERIDQMYNDMIEGYAMQARSWGMKEAEGDEDRARAERDLAKLGAVSPSAKRRSE
jgi:hypothetical protein